LGIEFFFSLSACGKNDAGLLVHHIFTDEICFQSIHIMHVCFSYVIVLMFITIAAVSTLVYYENRFTKDPTAK
jgi:hypothetical protein